MENYHVPQIPVQEEFLKIHEGNKAAKGFIEYQRHEAQMYQKYKEYYGYVFYIGKKIINTKMHQLRYLTKIGGFDIKVVMIKQTSL